MATTIEELRAVMRMELKPFMRDLQQMNGISAKAAKQVEQTWRNANRRLDGIGKNMAQSLIAPLTGVAAALGARELVRLTDVWTDLNGRVRIAAGGMREGTEVMGRLSDMARRTYSSLETTAESYLTNSQALKELGYSTNQQLDFTEALNNALVVSGAKGQRAEQVIQALGKAMAFGELRGENLNTVIQTGGRVAQALAEGLGVTTNELRKMGEQGKLKSSSVFTALTSQMQTLRDEADGMQATIGDALQLLQNSFLEYVGGADQAAGASARIAEAIILVADNMDTVANAALFAAQAIIGALAGRAMVGAGIQILTTAKALAEFVRIARAAQGLGGLGPAFASLGAQAGVIGLVVGGAAALALGHFANQAVEAKVRSEYVNAELERMGLVARDAAEGLGEAETALNDLTTAKGIAEAKERTEKFEQELQRVNREFEDLTRNIEQVAATSLNLTGEQTEGAAGYAQAVAKVTQAFKDEDMAAQDVSDALNQIAQTFPDYASQTSLIIEAAFAVERYARGLSLAAQEQAKIGVVTPTDNARIFRDADAKSMAPIIAGQTWLTEQNRRNALTREQRDLEDEIARIRKDTPDGAIISDSQIEALAKANLAWKGDNKKTGGSGSKADPFGDATKDMQRRIDMLVEETRLLGDINPLINDYGYSVEKLRAAQELENAATKAGIALGPERRGEIEKLATAYATATADAARLAEAQQATVAKFTELKDAARSALETIVDGFIEGKSAGDIFADVLKNIGSQLLQMGFNGLFGGGSTGGSGLFGKLFGFSGGGYTGPGGRNQPAGVVHKGEVVWSQSDIARSGGVAAVEAMRRGLTMPAMPVAANQGAVSVPISIAIDATGADAAGLARVEQRLAALQAELPGQVKSIVRTRGHKWR